MSVTEGWMISGNGKLIPVDCRKNGSEKDIPFDK